MALVEKYVEYKDIKLSQIPQEIREKIMKAHKVVCDTVEAQFSDNKSLKDDTEINNFKSNFCKSIKDSERTVRVYKLEGNKYDCMIQLMNHVSTENLKNANKIHDFAKKVFNEVKKIVDKKFNMRLDNENSESKEKFEGFDIYPDAEDSKQIWETAENLKDAVTSEGDSESDNEHELKKGKKPAKKAVEDDTSTKAVKESTEYLEVYQEADEFLNFLDEYIEEEAKEVKQVEPSKDFKGKLTALGKKIVDSKKVTDSDMKILTNEVKNEVLAKNKDTFKLDLGRFEFKLDNSKENARFEIVCDPPSSDFIKKFLNGTANLAEWFSKSCAGVKLNKYLLTAMKGTADIFHFQQNLFNKYIKKGLNEIFEELQKQFMALSADVKTVIGETELKSVFSLVLHQALCFTKVNFSDYKMFENAKKDVMETMDKVFTLLKGVTKENKAEVLKKIKEITKVYKENVSYSEMYKDIMMLESGVTNYLEGKYDDLIQKREREFRYKQFDFTKSSNFETNWQLESNQIQKLKPIHQEMFVLIKDQYKKIKNYKDKMKLAGYILSKLRVVNWYLEIQNKGNSSYLVPHSVLELENFQKELDKWYNRIMRSIK